MEERCYQLTRESASFSGSRGLRFRRDFLALAVGEKRKEDAERLA